MTAEEGDFGPSFACSANGFPTPYLSWREKNGGVALPNEVTLGENAMLVWHRALEYTDSGYYSCDATNNVGTNSAILDLLVRSEYEFPLSKFSSP